MEPANTRKTEESIIVKMVEDPVSVKHFTFFEDRVLEKFVGIDKSMTLELGCCSKSFNETLAERIGEGSRLIIIDPTLFLLDNVRFHLGSKGAGKVFFKSDFDWAHLPLDDGVFQSFISILFWDRAPNRHRILKEIARVLMPSGVAILATYLKESMREFFDLYAEILTQFDLSQFTPALNQARGALLEKNDYEQLVEDCDFGMCKMTQHPLRIEFDNGRDFFMNPLIRGYWAPLWEKIAGNDSDRIFWHMRKTMDSYFAGRKVPMTIEAGVMVAIK